MILQEESSPSSAFCSVGQIIHLCSYEGWKPLCQNKLFVEIVAFGLPGLWPKRMNLVPREINESELCLLKVVLHESAEELLLEKKPKTCDRNFGGIQKRVKILPMGFWVVGGFLA